MSVDYELQRIHIDELERRFRAYVQGDASRDATYSWLKDRMGSWESPLLMQGMQALNDTVHQVDRPGRRDAARADLERFLRERAVWDQDPFGWDRRYWQKYISSMFLDEPAIARKAAPRLVSDGVLLPEDISAIIGSSPADDPPKWPLAAAYAEVLWPLWNPASVGATPQLEADMSAARELCWHNSGGSPALGRVDDRMVELGGRPHSDGVELDRSAAVSRCVMIAVLAGNRAWDDHRWVHEASGRFYDAVKIIDAEVYAVYPSDFERFSGSITARARRLHNEIENRFRSGISPAQLRDFAREQGIVLWGHRPLT